MFSNVLNWDAPLFRRKAPKKAPKIFSKNFWPPKSFLLHFYTLIFGNNKFFEEKNFKKFFECLILQFLLHFIQKIIQKWWFLRNLEKAPPEILGANSAIWNFERHLDLQKRPFGAKAPVLRTLLTVHCCSQVNENKKRPESVTYNREMAKSAP